ncbi:hypothetical protein CEE36_01715 [candidate division TA06 bacterium B3_TA06]|uniref:Restriction endonuclease type IV Mrr domain-containing protein n=1 Tax=candidate division TA06 bacterium B3_TA06 TaxID=2012487 RepID=A0A532V9I9_UNCT6|nr:MAG: hypothetical protein CEE36_01715 [candidate division TA06 bacterium B3_TA06]
MFEGPICWVLLILVALGLLIWGISSIIRSVKRRKRRLTDLENRNRELSATIDRQRRQLVSKLAEIKELRSNMEKLKMEIEQRERLVADEKFRMGKMMEQREEEIKQMMEEEKKEISERRSRMKVTIEQKEAEINRKQEEVQRIIEESKRGMPWLGEVFADYFYLQDLRRADYLENKSHPAPRAAEEIRDIANKRREAEKRWRRAKYLLRYWQSILPHLFDFEGETIDEMIATTLNLPEEEEIEEGVDPAVFWQGEAVKEELSHQERLQRALDNWRRRPHKSRWQIGRDYERYVAWWYWEKGYKVLPSGVLYREEDLGRDVIAQKGKEVHIVQCKCWARWRTIYEKHIAQLYGTTMMYRVEQERKQRPQNLELFQKKLKVKSVFMTTTELSPVAHRFAEVLGVEVIENFKLEDYPLVKCNVNRQTGEKIYHLPFDQQYDRTKVERERGETYVWTIKEAEDLGFRRAFRWHGERGRLESRPD